MFFLAPRRQNHLHLINRARCIYIPLSSDTGQLIDGNNAGPNSYALSVHAYYNKLFCVFVVSVLNGGAFAVVVVIDSSTKSTT